MTRTLRLPDQAAFDALQSRLRAPAKPSPTLTPAPEGDRWPLELDRQLRLAGIEDQELEYRFTVERKWRFDIAWPKRMFAVEVDGAVHRIKSRFKADLEKHQAAFRFNWRVLRVSPAQVISGEALQMVTDTLHA